MSEHPEHDRPRLVVLLSGRGTNFQALERAIDQDRVPAQIAAAISDRADAAGLALAARAGIDTVCIEPRHFPDRPSFEQGLKTAIDGFAPHYVVLAGFMRVLGADLVRHYSGRMINIHPSLLPRHRGLDTHQRVLDTGERQHGASVHFVTPALDAGPVISQVQMTVRKTDTPDTLADRLLALEHRLYPATLALLLTHSVEFCDERIYLENQLLHDPLVLDRDFDDNGHLGQRNGGRD